MKEKLLEIKNLTKIFPVSKDLLGRTTEYLRAVNNISFSVYSGETFALVGESGCGKSTTSNLILRLLDVDKGSILYKDIDIAKANPSTMREIRKEIQVVFQDPYASLDPKWRVGDIISEPLKIYNIGTAKKRRKRALELMSIVGLRPEYYYRYPHEFSGGQRQRIGIARALALDPKIIIADEPVSALDVSIQAQIINMFKKLQRDLGLTYIFISHDLSVVKHISDRVGVMYLGEIVEVASTEKLFVEPKHPYTQALLSSIPVPNPIKRKELKLLEGEVPSAINPPSGCSFHPRCKFAKELCKKEEPAAVTIEPGHEIKCHLYSL